MLLARIVRQERGAFHIQFAEDRHGRRVAEPAGRLIHGAASALDLPVIGDWVLVSATEPAIIHTVVDRASVLARRAVGGGADVQPIAANVDVALVVQPLDQALNLRRIERTLVLARGARIAPVVVLTKTDLALDAARAIAEARAVAGEAPVVAVGLDDSLAALEAHLAPTKTAVMLGPSGAGKSTLINRLVGEERLAVGAVRESDAKGRHTTTHRELVALSNGAFLIDGPGMRELGLWTDGGDDGTFAEIAELAAECRFRDCQHHDEPGCAVLASVLRGELDAERLGSFGKLARESAYEASRTDAALRSKRQRSARVLSRAARDVGRRKRG